MKKILLMLVIVTGLIGGAGAVNAQSPLDHKDYMDAVMMRRYGKTITATAGDFRVGIRPGIFDDPAWVKIKLPNTAEHPIPEHMNLVSDRIYEYDIRVPNPTITRDVIWVSVDFESNTNHRRRPYMWSREGGEWRELPSKQVTGQQTFQMGLPFPWAIIAVLEDTTRTDAPTKMVSTAPPQTSFQAYTIMDGRTGVILNQQNGTVQKSPASMTKLMTAMVMLDQKLNMQEVLTYVAEDDASGARLRISPGETLTREDAFMTTLVGSGNNTANLLARTSGMTRDAFVAAMNAKAEQLGLTQTHFVDPSGLSTGNVTTANEYARVVYESGKYFDIFRAFQVPEYRFSTINAGVPHVIHSSNKLSVSKRTVVSKTGYLDETLYNLGTLTSDNDGNSLVVVTFGHPLSWGRFTDTAALIEWAWDAYDWP